MAPSQRPPRVTWINPDQSEILLDVAHAHIHLAADACVELTFSQPDDRVVSIELFLTGTRRTHRGLQGDGLQFFLVPHGPESLSVMLGEGSRSGVRPIAFHPRVVAVATDGTEALLAEGIFIARGPKDHGFFKADGPEGTWLEVSLGPWWGGVSAGASTINIGSGRDAHAMEAGDILLPRVWLGDGGLIRVSAVLGKLKDFPRSG